MAKCEHDWTHKDKARPEVGSVCMVCGERSARECRPGSGMDSGELKSGWDRCQHDWSGKSGGGSKCLDCGAESLRSCVDGSGLSSGYLTGPPSVFVWLVDKWAARFGGEKKPTPDAYKPRQGWGLGGPPKQ